MLTTLHQLYFKNSQNIKEVEDESVDLVVTSGPYPMIEMWDQLFCDQNPEIAASLEKGKGFEAFELMHKELDLVWNEVWRVLKSGGIACINIGDATRRINNEFNLYPSHSRVLNHCMKIGFSCLPSIIWSKQTNAPTKFMGSGMMPPGAYVTLEHEHIIVLRKGGKRVFKTDSEKKVRIKSAYFWEERNIWFSNVWELMGKHQSLNNNNVRKRSAAFPFELAYRLINMFSVKSDVVFDPFLGTGTTILAAMASMRNSIGIEIEENFREIILKGIDEIIEFANKYNKDRIGKHRSFMKKYKEKQGVPKYINEFYNTPVKTKQETEIVINKLKKINQIEDNLFQITYNA
ncbi:MAG: site-specific DNA-methyltransferase [Asgard group archaeon]|nr:site-specific DNA-methyltransferase [Asgard group archaeon]